jgi:hypothetical protein
MKKFSLYIEVFGTVYAGDVEAETEEEAIAIGNTRTPSVSLCHQCSGKFCDSLTLGKTSAEEQEKADEDAAL